MASSSKRIKLDGSRHNNLEQEVKPYSSFALKDEIRKTLLCSQCGKLAEKLIWLCKGGHNVCYICNAQGLQECRVCLKPVTPVRCHALERQLELLKEPSKVSCNSTESANSKKPARGLHSRKFSFNTLAAVQKIGSDNYVQYLVEDHEAKILNLELDKVMEINIYVNEITPESIQPRVLQCGEAMFILQHTVLSPDAITDSDSVTFWISTLLTENEASKYRFLLSLLRKASDLDTPYMEWSVKAHSLETPVSAFVKLHDACAVPIFILRPISDRLANASTYEEKWWNYVWTLECVIEKIDQPDSETIVTELL